MLEIVGTIASMIAAIILATETSHAPLGIVYVLWFVGSISLVTSSYLRKASWMILLMAFYSILNAIGVINLFLSGAA